MKQILNFNNELKSVKYGLWVDGMFSWLNSENWTNDYHKLTKKQIFTNDNLKLSIIFDTKTIETSILQEVMIINLKSEKRKLKLFISQTYANKDSEGITFYAPSIKAIVHSFNDTYLLVNGMLNRRGIVQYCTDFKEPCYLDDGLMMIQPLSSKNSVSIFSLEGEIEAEEKINAYFWLCKGFDINDLQKNNIFIKFHLMSIFDSKANYSNTAQASQ